MKPALVIGYGNPLREDDGIGWRAAELVESKLPAGAVEMMQCHQLTPEIAYHIEATPLVIFLDAAEGQAPGSFCCRPVGDGDAGPWSHHLTPEQVVALAKTIGHRVPPAVLITGGIARMGYGEMLSEAGEQSARKMAEEAIRLVAFSA